MSTRPSSETLEIQPADGGARYPSVTTMTDLVHMLNDGQFNADCAPDIKSFAEEMETLGCDSGKKVKGSITPDEVRDNRPSLEQARASIDALLGKMRIVA